jgi:hypothetical protein
MYLLPVYKQTNQPTTAGRPSNPNPEKSSLLYVSSPAVNLPYPAVTKQKYVLRAT